ncbi:hypothetical protein H0H12_20155 [Pseudomonas putida]|uniref:Uncharacterized protein n=1 Tax=Pseudomonas putida TaxID=303 RepID=A0A7D5VWE4_PSEPU|nr:hypothetical protein [Pseudomonas putida]QLJ12748.1 hypothetical protein H0H12_20155 [Pseudomonas putida]
MGLVLTATGSNFEANNVGFIPPVEDGLVYWGFLNDSVERLTKNYAANGSPAAIMGSPTVDSKGAVLDGSNHIRTTVTQSHSLTIIAVGNPVADGQEIGMFVSNYSGGRPNGLSGTSFGVSLFCGFDDTNPGVYEVRANVARFPGESGSGSGLNYVSLQNLNINKAAFLAMTFNGDEKIVRAWNLSTGASGQRPPIPDQVDVAVTPFYIGGTPNATWVNKPKNLHFVAMYDRDLSYDELQLIYERMTPYLISRGVTF